MTRQRRPFALLTRRLYLDRLEDRLSPAVLSLRAGLGSSIVSDAGISAVAPTTPQGSAPTIAVEANVSGATRQALLKFESLFGSGPNQIPVGSTIVSASLSIWVGFGASSATPIQLHRMLVPWTASTATWNSFSGNGSAGIQTDGLEAQTVADGNAGSSSETGYRIIGGLAAAIQAWASGGNNHGWVLTVPTTLSGWSFDSSESANNDHRPILTVQYQPTGASTFPDYVDLAGAPPSSMQSDWFTWQSDLETQRLNRVPSARTATYYFAQNGDDTTGAGEIGSPWKSLSKAQSILNSSSGDVRLRFRRGDTWREATTLQISRESITVDSYGNSSSAAPVFSRFTRTYTTGWTFDITEGLWSRSEPGAIGWLRTGSNPDSTILYRAAFKAEAAARLGSWFYDHIADKLYLSTSRDPNTLTGGYEASLADAQGWLVTADDVRLEDLQIQGSGMSTIGKGNGLEIQQSAGSEFVGINVAVTWAGGGGIRVVGSESSATLIGCTAGWLENRGGTGLTGSGDVFPFDINSGAGGHELILRDCTVIGGALPSSDWNAQPGQRHGRFGVFQSNNGPAMPPALSIALRTQYPDRGWQVVNGTNVFGPTAATLADVRAYIVGETPADGIDSLPGFGLSDRVYVNNVYTHLTAGRPVGNPQAFYSGGSYGSWVINSTMRWDASQLAANSKAVSLYQSPTPVDIRFENSRLEIVGIDTRDFEFVSSRAAVGANFVIRNSIVIESGARNTTLGSAQSPGRLDHNAYYFSNVPAGLQSIDPAGVILDAPPSASRVPAPDDPLHGAGITTALNFDQFGQSRPANRNDIGPTVGVTADPANRRLPYNQLPGVGQPPSPDDPAWFDWQARLQATRLANVPQSRTTTYYFDQQGSDFAGDGSATNPFQSLAWAQGLVSPSLATFNGGGSRLVAPLSPALEPNGKDFTIAFWGNFTNSGFSVVASKPGSWTIGYHDNAHIGFRLLNASQGTLAEVNWPSILSTGWHYFTAGFDSTNQQLRLSIDGTPAVTANSPSTPLPGSGPINLLAGTFGTSGSMDDAAYWSSAPGAGGSLDNTSIATLYSAGRGLRFEEVPPAMRPSMAAWWKLDEPTGAVTYSDALNNSPLTRQGAPAILSAGYQQAPADLRLRFQGGDTWKDTSGFVVQRTHVTLDSYGTGMANFSRFTQTYQTGWTNVSGNLWKRAEPVAVVWVRPASDPLGTIYKSERTSATTAGYTNSFFYDAVGNDPNSGGVPTLYLNPGPGVNPNTVVGGFEGATEGGEWRVEADNVRFQDLRVHGAGMTRAGSTESIYGLKINHHGQSLPRAEFVGVNLEFYFTGYHSMAQIGRNDSIVTFVNCRVGLCTNRDGNGVTSGGDVTPFVSYNDNGGQEFILADCEVSYGGLPSWDWAAQPGGRHGSFGTLQHTGSATSPALSIALRTRFPDNPWQVINSTRVYSASAANLAGVRAYIVGEAPADGISSLPGFGVFDSAYVNNVYKHLVRRPNSNTVALYYGQFSGWVINTTVQVDARDWQFTTTGHAIYFSNATTVNVQLINSRFEVINNNVEEFFLIQPFNSPVGSTFLMQNSIYSVSGTRAGRLGTIGSGGLDHNAYYSQVAPAGGMNAENDPAPVFLNRAPRNGAPAFTDPLAGAGATSSLGFDQSGRPRSIVRMDIGPWAAAPLPIPTSVRLGLGPVQSVPLVPGAIAIPAPIDRISAQFASDVDVGPWSLSLVGLDGQTIQTGSFSYDPVTRKATWMLQTPQVKGRFRLNLDSSYSVDFRLFMDGLR